MILKKHIFFTVLLGLLFMASADCGADVLYVHNYRVEEYVIGEKRSQVFIAYSPSSMMMDKETGYTSSWMKRLFGKVKTERHSTRFMLNKDRIEEVDWYNEKVLILPFERITDTGWIKQMDEQSAAVQDILKNRYKVKEPVLSIRVTPEKIRIGAWTCVKVVADLRLETLDMKKHAKSITLVSQQLWVSETIKGYDQYRLFYENLETKTGIAAQRLKGLSFLLKYWQGSLDPIKESLAKVKGYPVKNKMVVTARYISHLNTDSPRTVTKIIKQEEMELKEIKMDDFDKTRFEVPKEFKQNFIEKK
ncbi:hypothetical protein QUF76_05265 [Desulfobacterales bacterium HSG16]|nr:hypothetical protein [Desulfobacterales bacterium HSG16]